MKIVSCTLSESPYRETSVNVEHITRIDYTEDDYAAGHTAEVWTDGGGQFTLKGPAATRVYYAFLAIEGADVDTV